MLRSALSRASRRVIVGGALSAGSQQALAHSAARMALPGHVTGVQLIQRAFMSNWLSGPRGRPGSLRGPGVNNRLDKEGEEESTATTATSTTGPFFDIQVYDVEQAMEGLLDQQQPALGFLLLHDFRQASLDDLVPPAAKPVVAVEEPTDEEGHQQSEEGGGGMQLIKRTYQPSVLRKKRVHGFLSRQETRDGRKVISRRRRKNRARLAV